MRASAQVLVVEDDPEMQAYLCSTLEADGCQTRAVATGEAALAGMEMFVPDLIILDLQLAGKLTGFDVLAKVRQRNQAVRVIILTQLPGEERSIQGLELGADDYINKGLSTHHLLARVHAQFRRTAAGASEIYRCGDAVVDLQTSSLVKDGRRMLLGPVERQVLARLVQDAGQVVSSRDLVRAGWNFELPDLVREDDTHVLRTTVFSLRKKIGDVIVTHRGVGFKLLAAERVTDEDRPTT